MLRWCNYQSTNRYNAKRYPSAVRFAGERIDAFGNLTIMKFILQKLNVTSVSSMNKGEFSRQHSLKLDLLKSCR